MATRLTTSSTSNNTSGSHSMTMAELMQKTQSSLITPHKGVILKGKITKLTSAEILVDINAKTEAVVLEKDRKLLRNLLTTLSVGSEVDVQVLNPESDLGYPVVSLRRFLGDKTWEKLESLRKNQEATEVTVTEMTRGGFLVSTEDGMFGFMPNSYTALVSLDGKATVQDPQELVGKKIKAFILELSRQAHKIIFSQKPVLKVEDFNKLIKHLKMRQKVEAIVTNIAPFGVFVLVNAKSETSDEPIYVDGLLHASEISWSETQNMQEFQVGQVLEAVIIGFDQEGRRVDVSVKRLTADPFDELAKHLVVDQKVTGTIARVAANAIYVNLAHEELAKSNMIIEAIIRKEKVPPNVTYKPGDQVTATITQVDPKRHRVVLVPVLKEKPIGYR